MSQVSNVGRNERIGARASADVPTTDANSTRLTNLIAVLQSRLVDDGGRVVPHGRRSFRAVECDVIVGELSEDRLPPVAAAHLHHA